MPTFDYAPLTETIDRDAVQRVRDEAKKARVQPLGLPAVDVLVVALVTLALVAGLIAVVWFTRRPFQGLLGLEEILYFLIFGIIELFTLCVSLPYAIYLMLTQWGQYYRAHAFAERNGMTYTPTRLRSYWDGTIFRGHGDGGKAMRVFRATPEPAAFEVGNYIYRVPVDPAQQGRNRKKIVHWGYIVVDLGYPAPRLLLRSKSRASRQRWGRDRNRDPVLSLGAKVDRRFTLHCPAGAENEARAIFGPEFTSKLMALGTGVDVQVTGSHLYVYRTRGFRLPRPQTIKSLFAIVSEALPVVA